MVVGVSAERGVENSAWSTGGWNATELRKPLLARAASERIFRLVARCVLGFTLLIIGGLFGSVLWDALPRLSWSFLTSFPSRKAEQAGIYAALVGSLELIVLTIAVALPVGTGAAVYLEEYSKKGRMTRLIEVAIANLAGVPSIMYGLLGLQIFVRVLRLERSLISGALTLGLLVLPVIIMTAREALRTVPKGYREGALALGATQWQTVWTQVLPSAFPGILTGCILGFARALGETAPLVTLGALTYVAQTPDSLFSPFTALPIQAFNWLSRPQAAFHANAAAAIVVLLSMVVLMNGVAAWLRGKLQIRTR
jgi:phosphate transport system permease protein